MKARALIFTMLLVVLIGLFVFSQPVVAKPASAPPILAVIVQAGPITVDLTQEFVGMVAGALLSLACSYMPGVAPAYNKLSDDWKRLIMLLLMIGVTGGVIGLGCAGIIGGIECTQNTIVNAVLTLFFAAMANQTTHNFSPRIGAKAKQPSQEALPETQ